jgi:hypothetical protein
MWAIDQKPRRLAPVGWFIAAVGRRGVRILGTDLTGTKTVTFNGTPAALKVFSKTRQGTLRCDHRSEIQVKYRGRLSSNLLFIVLP